MLGHALDGVDGAQRGDMPRRGNLLHARLRHASAKTTLDTMPIFGPDFDESTRTAIDAVRQARAEAVQSADSL